MAKELDVSLFKIYSVGTVADNKALNSKVINVLPNENASSINGELASNPKQIESSGKDSQGKAYTVAVTTDNVIEATWLPFGSNRVTAPDVRRGERVLIWQYGDADKYYWTDSGLDSHLRRLETVVYAFSNIPSPESREFDPSDYYFFEVSTHAKHITLRTSKSDGEPFEYVVQIDTKAGKFTVLDDTKNSFELDSKAVSMKMNLYTGTKVELEKMNILIEALKEVKVKVGGTEQTWTPALTTLKTPAFKGKR